MAKVKVCLDAGHYGKYNHSTVVPELYESDFNWKIHLLQKKYLEEYGIEVITTRQTQAKDLDLYQRGRAAKGCNVFLSNHANWAARESADYPVCYVPLNGSGNELGLALAKCIETVMETKEKARINTKQSTKGPWDWYGVIYGAVEVGVPGIIIEHSFYSNKKAAEFLINDECIDKMARAEAAVIAEHFGLKKLETTPAVPKQEVTESAAKVNVYRAISGAYKERANADTKLATVRKTYPNAILIAADGYYKIQIDEFDTAAKANKKVAEVKAKGLDCYVSTDKTITVLVDKPTAVTESTTISKASYRAISGAYTSKVNADKKLATVRKTYPNAIMIKVGNYYKIQIAQFSDAVSVSAKVAEVKKKGLDCYVSTDKEAEIVVEATVTESNTQQTTTKPTTQVSEKYTHEQFVREVQAAIGAKVDGKAGPETLSKTVTVSRYVNNKHAVVKPVQKWLYELGYTEVGSADGVAGAKFEAAVKRFQKENGRNVDGEITANQITWKKLLKLQ